MTDPSYRGTLLNIDLLPEDRYGRSFVVSIALHVGFVLFVIAVPYLLPQQSAIEIGTGPGGGVGGETYTVGVVDELAGGTGMTKPSLIPQPPALPETATKEEPKPEAVPLPNTIEPKKPRRQEERAGKKETKPQPNTNVIPTSPRPGAGGTGGMAGGSGGGQGGGIGISIGAGSGGLAESWYARAVEDRISRNWIKPAVDIKYQVVFSFYIAGNGTIYSVQKEQSSGNDEIDRTAERAIQASNPLAPPPPEFRGTPVKFVAQFAN